MVQNIEKRILGFDLVRVISIFVVLIIHGFGYAGSWLGKDLAVRTVGYASLGVFTFISAFLLSSKYSFTNKTEIMTFYKKRVLRIYPLFVVSSVLLVIIGINAWVPTIKGLLGISPFRATNLTTMWYVAMLLSLYIITPFVVRGGIKQQCFNAVAVMTVIGLIEIIFKTVVPRTFNYYSIYMVGLLLGRNYNEQTMRFLRSKKTLFISLAWMILVVIVFLTKNNYLRSVSIIIGIIALLNISLLTAEKLRTGRLFTGSVTALSYASFCAYLFHREVIWVMFHVFKPQGSMPIFLYVLIVGVPLSFFCAYWIQKGYDKLLEKMTRRPDGYIATTPNDNR